MLAVVSPSTKTVEDLFEILKEHLKPQPTVLAKRYKLYCRDQIENETISDYIAVLQKLNLNCDFREFLDEALGDRFVYELINASIRRRLLGVGTLKLKIAIYLAKKWESAEIETKLVNTEIKAELNAICCKAKISKMLLMQFWWTFSKPFFFLKSTYATLTKRKVISVKLAGKVVKETFPVRTWWHQEIYNTPKIII